MSYRSKTQPLCRCCGKKIKKYTSTEYFGDVSMTQEGHEKRPTDIKKLKRRYNQQIVAHRYIFLYGSKRIWHVSLWDGETYEDEFFCSNLCAAKFGRHMAYAGHSSRHYYMAMQKQES